MKLVACAKWILGLKLGKGVSLGFARSMLCKFRVSVSMVRVIIK